MGISPEANKLLDFMRYSTWVVTLRQRNARQRQKHPAQWIRDTELSGFLQSLLLINFIGIIRRAIRLQLSMQIAAAKLPLQIPDVGLL